MPPNDLDKLIAGFGRFRRRYYHDQPSLFAHLRYRQAPRVMVIACCDSRVHPDVITDTEPGELFVVRNIANLVPPYEEGGQYHGTSAALEFAVCGLNVEHVIVLGHARCGGIQALLSGTGVTGGSGFVEHWMAIVQEARDAVLRPPAVAGDAAARALELAAVRVSMRNLLSFPWIRTRVDAGTLSLHGWYFDLDVGELLGLDKAAGDFAPLARAGEG
jgi:carbonic anhydrase